MAVTSEYNIAYGVQVIDNRFKLSVGAGYRYIQGLGIADVRVEQRQPVRPTALSPLFNINYGAMVSNPDFNYETGSGLKPVGSGNGYDVGLAAEIGKMVRLGASVTDWAR